jgi:hypothetical protein
MSWVASATQLIATINKRRVAQRHAKNLHVALFKIVLYTSEDSQSDHKDAPLQWYGSAVEARLSIVGATPMVVLWIEWIEQRSALIFCFA